MFSLFNRLLFKSQSKQWRLPVLPNLDSELYPLTWQQHTIASAEEFVSHIIKSSDKDYVAQQAQFSQLLQQHAIYQDWINFTVYGRYVQRSFSAFYQQTEDVFNADMPELLKHELVRHAQRLPLGQILWVGGKIHTSVRQEELLITTLNPFKALDDALHRSSKAKPEPVGVSQIDTTSTASSLIINLITATSDEVKAFAVKHNKRTKDALLNEVMILDFNRFVLTKEEMLPHKSKPWTHFLIRHYNIG